MSDITLWRYLSNEKWMLLLKDKGLFFSRASNFEDKQEGYYVTHGLYSGLEELHPEATDIIVRAKAMSDRIRDRAPKHTYISCWQNIENESSQMWKAYVPDLAEGVLIKTNILALLWNIPKSLTEVITGANCKYYKDEDENLNLKHPFEYKEEKYFFEKEYRLIIDSITMSHLTGFNPDGLGEAFIMNDENQWIPFHEQYSPKDAGADIEVKSGQGYVVKYPLEKILHEVRVHPLASDVYLSKVRADLQEAGIRCQVNHSSITPEDFSKT